MTIQWPLVLSGCFLLYRMDFGHRSVCHIGMNWFPFAINFCLLNSKKGVYYDKVNHESYCHQTFTKLLYLTFIYSDVTISSSIREWLRSPTFDSWQWEDEELLTLLQSIFFDLDLLHKFNIPLATLRNFIYEVYNNYNEVSFHNFRHCFCVTQMVSFIFEKFTIHV